MFLNFGQLSLKFLSTPSARRATSIRVDDSAVRSISIHALREEGDSSHTGILLEKTDFYPRPPRGGRRLPACETRKVRHFYPRPPRGGRPLAELQNIMIRAISIHALREEGDQRGGLDAAKKLLFLSTPSARRATAKTETKSLFSNKLYNILHEFRRALIYNGSKSYPNRAK